VLRSLFAELLFFLVFEHAKGLGGVIRDFSVGGIEHIAQLIAGQAVLAGEESVEFGANRKIL
jgi:hypothetical protein